MVKNQIASCRRCSRLDQFGDGLSADDFLLIGIIGQAWLAIELPALLKASETRWQKLASSGPVADDRVLSPLALNAHGNAHAAADAERGQALLGTRTLHFMQQRDQHARTRCADGVTNGNGTAIDVDLRSIPTHVLVHSTGLRGKGFIGFNKIKIRSFPARLLQVQASMRNWARTHDGRINASR